MTMIPRRLLVRPSIQAAEPLNQFLQRASGLNRLRSPTELLALASLPSLAPWRRCDLSALASLLHMDDPGSLEAAAYWPRPGTLRTVAFGQVDVPSWAVNFSRSRICPACVLEAGAGQRIWDLCAVTACPNHCTPLVDACTCGRPLSFHRPSLAICRCGRSVEASTAVSTGQTIATAQALAALARGIRPAGVAPVASLTGALRLLRFGMAAGDVEATSRRSATISKPDVATVAARLEMSADILLDWPGGLHRLLAENARDTPGKVGLEATFGTFIQRLRAALSEPDLVPIADEVRNWLGARDDAPVMKAWSFFRPRTVAAPRLTARQAADLLSMASTRIVALVQDGSLAGGILPMGRRRAVLVEPGSVKRLLAERLSLVTASTAAAALGASRKQIGALGRRGLLCPPGLSGEPSGRSYRRPSVEALAARLSSLARPPTGEALVRLSEVPALRRIRLPDLIASVLAGEVPLVAVPETGPGTPILGRYAVVVDDTYRLRHRPDGAALGAARAAERLGLSQRMIPVLVRAGCLDQAGAAEGHTVRGVTAASVQAFPRRYVLASVVARSWGTSTRAIAARFARAGLKPVVATDSARGISAVWSAEAAERALEGLDIPLDRTGTRCRRSSRERSVKRQTSVEGRRVRA